MIELPAGFRSYARRSPAWDSFVRGAARAVADISQEWGLRLDGEPRHGEGALVVPVVDERGGPAALKVGFVDPETEHEALALQHWHGDGAVRLLRADPHRGAMLLERLATRDLSEEWDIAACETVAELYSRLHRVAPPQLRLLSVEAERWAGELRALPRSAPLPRRMVEQAAGLAASFADDAATDGRLIHTDLHYAHVLAGERHPWLAISPRPLSGDPHFEPAPMLWNRWEELSGDIRGGVRRRFEALVDTAMLDEDRARDWVVVRAMVAAMRSLAGPNLDSARVTRCVSLAKAVQP